MHAAPSRFTAGFVAVVCMTVAFIAWFEGNSLAWRLLMNGPPTAGMYGAAWPDIHHETPEETRERLRLDRKLSFALKWSIRTSWAAAALSLVAAIYVAWGTRQDSRGRRFGSALFALLAAAVFALTVVF